MIEANDRIAIITGGSRGLGRNTAVNLARRGVDVIFTYHSNAPEAQSLLGEAEAIGRKAAAFQLDAGNISSFDRFVDDVRNTLRSWGRERFDYLVNNAGTSLHKPFDQTTEAEFDQIVNVHFKGVYFLTQKLLPLIRDGGRIVNISSGLARFSMPGTSAYGAAKGAIEVFTRYLAKELGPRGYSQRGRPRSDPDRFQRRHGARQSGSQQARRGDDRVGTRWRT